MPKYKRSKKSLKIRKRNARARYEEEEERDEDELDEEEEAPAPEEGELNFSWLKDSLIPGLQKMGKGVLGTFASIGMGLSGLGAKDAWEVLRAPVKDWIRMWQEKREELNADRNAAEMMFHGGLGFITGMLSGVLSGLGDLAAGIIQVGGGVTGLAKMVKDFGVPEEVIQGALKSGHPLSLFAGAVFRGVDKLDVFLKKLTKDIEQYQSLADVRQKALDAIERGNYMEAIEHGTKAAEALTGKDLSAVRKAAAKAQKVYESSPEFQQIVKHIEKNILPNVKELVKELGVDPKRVIAKQGKILFEKEFPADKRVEAVKKILGKNPTFGIIAQATSYDDALKKLVAHNDPQLVDKLAVVNIIGKPGEQLTPDEIDRLKEEAREQLESRVEGELRSKAGGKIEKVERTLADLKERKDRFEREMSEPSREYRPSKAKPKRPASSAATPSKSKKLRPRPRTDSED